MKRGASNPKPWLTMVSLFCLFVFSAPLLSFAQSEDKLGFLIWGQGDPVYVPKGETGSFTEGELVSLLHSTQGFDFGKDAFAVEMKVASKTVSHSFSIDSFAGKSAWLIVDPAGTDATPSFTDRFLAELCALPAGDHGIEISFKVNGRTMNQGALTFKSDGKHAKYKDILESFKNVTGARDMANEEFQRRTEAEEMRSEEEERAKAAANRFTVTIQNKNSGYTFYIIAIDTRTLSETVYEVLPQKSEILELFLDQSYTLKAFNQNEAKSGARIIATVDESWNDETIIVK